MVTVTYGKYEVNDMGRYVFGTSVQGASHIRAGKPCQDSSTYRDFSFTYRNKKSKTNDLYAGLDKDICIISVADGHGSESCPYSQTGSQIAINVFSDLMAEFCIKYKDNMESLCTYLNREADTRIAKAIDNEWKKRVLNQYKLKMGKDKEKSSVLINGEKDKEAIYKMYGTTLLGLVITRDFSFAFQLGDGDICYVDNTGVKPVLKSEKILGVETHSLSKRDAWKNAVSRVLNRDIEEQTPFMYMLTTDGMSNSYVSETEFYKSCQEYYQMIQEHGSKTVEENLPGWLSETSSMGCGDDISAVIAYYDEK